MEFIKIFLFIKRFLYFSQDRIIEKKRIFSLRNKLFSIIKKSGSISFHDFMENALYDPMAGFYMKRVVFDGDFTTSPKKYSPYYGQGIASLIEQLDAANKERGGIQLIVSIAAGDATLDRDLLDWLYAYNPELYKRIRYES